MRTLYIIGNGFDMYHGLNTSYQSFGFFLKNKHSQIFDYLTDYYGLPYLYDMDEKYYEWNYFESALANLEYQNVLDENSEYLPNPASDDFRDRDWHAFQQVMEGVVDDLTTNLFTEFKEFILNVNFPKIEPNDLLRIDINSLFISFNYTDTLEQYYNVPEKNIFYIHNKAKSRDTLILGHGTDPDNFIIEEKKMPDGLSFEEQQEWHEQMADSYDYSYDSGRDELLGYFSKSFKYTEDIINQNSSFFNKLQNIKKVVVLGHSISEVDQSYFEKIIKSIRNNTIWIVSYHNPNEKEARRNRLNELGIKNRQIILVQMNDLLPDFWSKIKLSLRIALSIIRITIRI